MGTGGHIIFRHKNRSYYIFNNMNSTHKYLGVDLETWLKNKLKEDLSLSKLREIIEHYHIFKYDCEIKKPKHEFTISVSRIVEDEEGEYRYKYGNGDDYNIAKYTHSDGSVSYQEDIKCNVTEEIKEDLLKYLEAPSNELNKKIYDEMTAYPNILNYIDRGCTLHCITESCEYEEYKKNMLLASEFKDKKVMTPELLSEFTGDSDLWGGLINNNQIYCSCISIQENKDDTVNSGLTIQSDYGYLIDLDNNYYCWTGKYVEYNSSSFKELKNNSSSFINSRKLMHDNNWRQEARFLHLVHLILDKVILVLVYHFQMKKLHSVIHQTKEILLYQMDRLK